MKAAKELRFPRLAVLNARYEVAKKKNEMRYYTIYPIRIRQLQLQNELEDEGILLKPLQYYDNQPTVDELLSKPDGLLYVIDEASRTKSGHSFIIGKPFTSTL